MRDQPKPALAYESSEPQRAPKLSCPKCGGRMLQGVVTNDRGRTTSEKLEWIEGEIERRWFGLVRMPRGTRFEVIAYRCPDCGLVEFYSPAG